MAEELQKTPLHAEHVARGGKLVPFGGWEMPLHYTPGIIKEHEAVRSAAGLFDVSHMGRFEVQGPGALSFSNYLISNNLEKIDPGRLLYSAICNEDGGVIDDVTVYRMPESVLFVVNASNRERVWRWMEGHYREWSGPEITVQNRSEGLGQLALQGPKSQELIASHVGGDIDALGYYHFRPTKIFGAQGVISRNGYTGEDGFEIYIPHSKVVKVWNGMLDAGKSLGILPAGLGCRDTLRLEMGFCLYGNELNPQTSPLEAGLGWTVKLKQKNRFIGKKMLIEEKEAGLERTLIGFEVEGRRLARQGQPILEGDKTIGSVTSGAFSPSLQQGIGLGLVHPDHAEVGTDLEVDVRGSRVPVRVVERPFYKQGSHR